MKIHIEKIPVEMYRTVHTKDAAGKLIRDREKYKTFKKIKCVETGPRLGHYILDGLCVMAVVLPLAYILERAGLLSQIGESANIISIPFFDIKSIIVTFTFYFLFENSFQRTPGKWVTRTIVVNEFGEKPDAGTIAVRSLCRLIPFEAFSCLSDSGRGWHDKLSKTYVLPMAEYEDIKSILADMGAENNLT
jgi:uncharacterized RDD family membrane protein YckC